MLAPEVERRAPRRAATGGARGDRAREDGDRHDGSLQGLQLVRRAAATDLLGTSIARLPGDGGARWCGARDR